MHFPFIGFAGRTTYPLGEISLHGIGEVMSGHHTSRRCYVNALRRRNQKESLPIHTDEDRRDESHRPTPVEKLVKVEVDGLGMCEN